MEGDYNMSVYAVVFWLIVLPASAQQSDFILEGRVLDAQSNAPVSIASLQNGRELILTNVKGEFRIRARVGDRLLVSHTAYESQVYVVEANASDPVEILLAEKFVDLSEVEVSYFPSEEIFKKEALKAVPHNHYEYKLADRNLQMIKQIVPLDFEYEFSPFSSALKNGKSLTDVSFFSTNASIGLIRAIRQLGSKKFASPAVPQRFSQEARDPVWIRKKRNWGDYFDPQ